VQCVAACCSVQHTYTAFEGFECVCSHKVPRYSVLKCVAVRCSVLQRVAACCNVCSLFNLVILGKLEIQN